MGTQFRRGFKTECEKIAAKLRRELRLKPDAPLDLERLVAHIGVVVLRLSDFAHDAPRAAELFAGTESGAFSAVTLIDGDDRLIVHNDSHTEVRQASNVSHEVAHAILKHPPAPPLNDLGCRNFDHRIEDEATWLGATLLVPEPATMRVARNGIPIVEGAAMYGVSLELMRWRLNMTGALKRYSSAS